METILIIDDEEDLVEVIEDNLISEGYKVLKAYNGYDGIEMCKLNPNLVLLDIMMPDIDGYNVCYSIRDKLDSPIIFLSAKANETDKIKGLGIGADDYLTKPFSLEELTMRIKAHLRRERRLKKDNINSPSLFFNNLNLDLKAKAVLLYGENINLTKKEYEIIELLVLNPGQVFSRDQIYDRIWGYNATGDSSTVAEHIKRLRQKLGSHDFIKTVWGIGYKWEV